ncbi:MAG: hypothetical protein C5B51_12225 [Terriglobia bacterium]|nr:MAG: hypothetical protein C5B51_12225 [Terriglobia bacterium]
MRGPVSQNRDRKEAVVSTYLITFACYGSWLPGQAGAIDCRHNLFGSPLPGPDTNLEALSQSRMRQAPYVLDTARRHIVLQSIQQVCGYRKWLLLAAHVRTNHVHAVVEADQPAEQVMGTLKAYASRALNTTAVDPPNRQRWARHGSTRYLWTSRAVTAAVHYFICEQGEIMAAYQLLEAT